MSIYIQKAYEIIDEFDDRYKKELCGYYFSLWKDKLKNAEVREKLPVFVLADLRLMFNKYLFLEEKEFVEFELRVFRLKILEMRACILDLVDSDYSEDIENIYKPEKWVLEVVKDLQSYFDFSNAEYIKIFEDFNSVFLEELRMIFVSRNRRFGKNGNQLVLNLLFYKRFVDKVTECNFECFFAKFTSNFRENSFKGFEALEDILDARPSPNN